MTLPDNHPWAGLVEYMLKHKCPRCDGKRFLYKPWTHKCPKCDGKGIFKEPEDED